MIMFQSNGGTAVDTREVENAATEPIPEAQRTMPTISRDGYEFIGWYDSETAAAEAEEAVAGGETAPESVKQVPERFTSASNYIYTYYAAWNPLTSIISFDADNGEAVEGSSLEDRIGVTDQAIANDERTMPEVTREGYTFRGWYAQDGRLPGGEWGEEVLSLPARYPWNADGVSEDGKSCTTTYYVKWEADAASITFITDGGTDIDMMNGYTGESTGRSTFPETTWNGYTLDGWYTSPSFEADTKVDEDAFPTTFQPGDNVYYAKWTANKAYIVFNSNWNADHNLSYEGVTDQKFTELDDMPIFEENARPGWSFDGWFDEAGNQVTLLPTAFQPGTITFVGKWHMNGNGMYLFNTNGGTAVAEMSGVAGTEPESRDMPETGEGRLHVRRLVRRPVLQRRQGRAAARALHRDRDHLLCQVGGQRRIHPVQRQL